MAQTYVTDNGTLIIPGAYPTIKVAADNSGLSTTGVIALVGEADAGPKWDLEADLEANAFGPDQLAAIVSKYRSGPLVDAARALAQPSNDPSIVGAPSRLVLVKTNNSLKASRTIQNVAASTYGVLADKSYGKLGNLIQTQITAEVAESLPTTGSFTFIPPVGTVNLNIRANGGAALGVAVSAAMTPTAFVTAVNALAGVAATGGVDRVAHPTTGNLSLTATGLNVVITTTSSFPVVPSIGDTLVIPATSVLAGTGSDNVGAYVVTAASAASVAATKLSDAAQSGAVIGAPVSCVTVGSAGVGGTPANNLIVYSPVVITLEAGAVVDGVGKTLEIDQLATGTDLFERCAFALSTTAVGWVSKSTAPTVIAATAEQQVKLTVTRQADSVTEELIAGGDVALGICYTGTTATLTITDTTLTTTVVGGAGANLSITLADFATIADLAAFIATQPGYSASVVSNALGQLPPSALDNVSGMGIATDFGAKTGRVKTDAFKFFQKISTESVLVQLENTGGTVVAAGAGLPAVTAAGFLSGGAKGSTLAADVVAAVDALEKVSCNFVVPLMSRDATADIADGLTESGSTYTIGAINAYVKTHVNKMSTLKRKKNRQAFLSYRGTFTAARTAALELVAYRCSVAFQDVKLVGGDGTIRQFQPWMTAALAAGMQAAGFYRAIVAKAPNVSGVLQAARDFDDRSTTDVENALLSGLLVLARQPTGGVAWVSDQTTYSKDSNFVYNSVQAVYAADTIALTVAQRMERAFAGMSVADVSAALAKSYLDAVMSDIMRLKLIAPSSDAPKGFKNAAITISGPVMAVSLEIKLAGAIYFIPINFLVSQVQQSA